MTFVEKSYFKAFMLNSGLICMSTGKQDRRVRKTKTAIKEAYLQLAADPPKQGITITAIADIADINRKTFYCHYETIEDMERDLEKDILKHVTDKLDELDTGDMEGAILIYYRFLDTDDPGVRKMLYDEKRHPGFFDRITNAILSSDFFQSFCGEALSIGMMRGYMDAATGIYLTWRDDEEPEEDLEELSRKAAKMIIGGLNSLKSD